MSTLTHPKFHRHNHHTVSVSSQAYPDSAHDPIASYDNPYQGDFVCDGKIVSSDENLNFNFKHSNLALLVSSDNIAISATGDALFNGNLSANSITFNKDNFKSANFITTSSVSKYWIVYIDNKPYGVRLWNEEQNIEINGTPPYFLPQLSTTFQIESYPYTFAEVIVDVRGTVPINIQWYKDSTSLDSKSFKVFNLNPSLLMIKPGNSSTTYQWASASLDNITNLIDLIGENKNTYKTKHPGYYTVIATTPTHHQLVDGESETILISRSPGVYRCVATNMYGSVTSVDITVTDPFLD